MNLNNVKSWAPTIILALYIVLFATTPLLAAPVSVSEAETEIVGEVSIFHIDDFANKSSKNFYYIDTNEKRYSFESNQELPFEAGSIVKIKGKLKNDVIAVDTVRNPVELVSEKKNHNVISAIKDSVGDQRTLVILMKSFPSDSEPFTPAEAHNMVFKSRFQSFMKEQSYGKVSFSGKVIGWVPINRNVAECETPSEAEYNNIFSTHNINLASYDRVLILRNDMAGGCSSVGKAPHTYGGQTYHLSKTTVGLYRYDQPSDWGTHVFPWTNLDLVLSHEMGHALGVGHSNSWICDGEVIYGNCQHFEYGNHYDAMATGSHTLHYNAYFKEKLGWLSENQILNITQSGSFTLTPLEMNGGSKIAKIYINGTNEAPFFVEFRRIMGYDLSLGKPELSINQYGAFVSQIGNTAVPTVQLLDMSPEASHLSNNMKNVTLNPVSIGNSLAIFHDQGKGITLHAPLGISRPRNAISMRVDISNPSCTRGPMSITNLINDTSVSIGGASFVSANIRNNDHFGCGNSDFEVSFGLPAGWSYENTSTVSILPGQTKMGWGTFKVPATTTLGNYPVTFKVKNKTTGQIGKKTFQVFVDNPLSITNATPSSGQAGTVVTVTGTGFNSTHTAVTLTGNNSWSDTEIVSVSNGSFQYVIPAVMNTCNKSNCHTVPLSNGDYHINVYSNNVSVNTPFRVGATSTVSISANPISINLGQSSIITWNAQNVAYCFGQGGLGGVLPSSGQQVVYPLETTLYEIRCMSAVVGGGFMSESVTVTVVSPTPRDGVKGPVKIQREESIKLPTKGPVNRGTSPSTAGSRSVSTETVRN
ncbi:MAG TPA: IPT/TIG domain-containing protein [Candidatus Paceibacterota bacterium]|nr:IPT/TIG domain-containing protein [Candidatus Paceibacterota bacterium]